MAESHDRELFQEALRAGERRNYSKAARLLTHLVSHTDRYPQAVLYLGRSYHALGEHDRAVLAFEFFLKMYPESEAGHFFLGRTYLALGYLHRAAARLRFVTEHNPDFLPALSFLGLAYLKMRKPDHAVECFERALEIDPENPRLYTGYLNALLIKGIRLFHRGVYAEAEEIFRFIEQKRGDSVLTHLYLGRIYRLSGRNDLSFRHYDEASRLSPQDPVFPLLKAFALLRAGDADAAFRELETVRQLDGSLPLSSDPDTLLRLVTITLFRSRRYREAVSYARQLLKKNYRDPDMHAIVAESYLNLEEYEKAKNHFARSLDSDRSRLDYHHGLALALWHLKDFETLRREIRRIRAIDPADTTARYFEGLCMTELESDPQVSLPILQELVRDLGPDPHLMYALGREYLRSGMPELSEGWLIRTLKLDEAHRNAYLSLLEAYRQLGETAKAKDTLERYLEHYPQDLERKRHLVQLLIDNENFGEAARKITDALSRDPRNKLLKQKLAYCHVKDGKFGEAAVVYRNLLRDDPYSVDLLRSLVSCLDKSGHPERAIQLLKKAAGAMKDDPAILLPLGVLYSRNSDYERAKEIFRRVLSLFPNDWRAYQNLGVLYRRTGQADFADKFFETARRHRS